ncbi:MAG: sialidase [Pedosphaera sp.]|nr:sialidase [Pedosphaera sp.]
MGRLRLPLPLGGPWLVSSEVVRNPVRQEERLGGRPDASRWIRHAASFAQCHATTLAETKAGLVAAWFGGTREGNKDVGIWIARCDGKGWSAPIEVANGIESPEKRHPCWNPVLFQPATGPLLLFYKAGPSPSTWWGMLITSGDAGKTWSAPRRLPEGVFGPIKNKPVSLADGALLCPTSSEHDGWRVHFERTMDLRKTWTKTEAINDGKTISAIQPSVLFHPQNRLQALGRSRQGKLWEAWSEDGGKTWGAMKLTSLPNPNSGADAVTLKDGRHLLVYNHTAKGRSPLNVALSPDGKEWQAALVLEDRRLSWLRNAASAMKCERADRCCARIDVLCGGPPDNGRADGGDSFRIPRRPHLAQSPRGRCA